jgi:hypothetical protein
MTTNVGPTVTIDRDDLLAAWRHIELARVDINSAVNRMESALSAAKQAQLTVIHAYDTVKAIMEVTFR